MSRILGQVFFAISIMIVVYLTLNLVVRPKKDYVLRFRPLEVASVQLHSKRGDVLLQFVGSGDSGYWVVSDGQHEARPADSHTVGVLLAVLARIDYIEKIDAAAMAGDSGGAADLKLGHTLVASVTLLSGKSMTFALGREAPSGTEYFASNVADPQTVYLVSNRFYSLLQHNAVDFWKRQIFVLPQNATQIQFSAFGKVLDVTRQGGEWSHDHLIRLCQKLSFTQYFDTTDADNSDLAQFGLTVPNLEISIVQETGAKTVYRVAYYRQAFYLQVDDVPAVFIMAPETVDPLMQALRK